jgi:hypothetical protein
MNINTLKKISGIASIIFFILIIIIIIVIIIQPPSPPSPQQENKLAKEDILLNTKRGKYALKFIDNFSNLNKDNWSVSTMGLDTLTNTCANYVKENVFVKDNELIVKAGPNNPNSSDCMGRLPGSGKKVYPDSCVNSGRIVSKYSQKYGVFIFGAKVPKGKDLFPALWLVGTGDWPKTGEIDMMETIRSVNQNSSFSSRIMIPIDSDFMTPGSKNYWVATSVPSDSSTDIQLKVDPSFWNDYHVFALDWKLEDDGDVTYKFYLDVKMSKDGKLVNYKTGVPGVPYKSYSLKDLVNKYRNHNNNNLADYKDIRDAVSGQRMIMNIAVSGRDSDANGCSYRSCNKCDTIDDTMNIQYVQIWK